MYVLSQRTSASFFFCSTNVYVFVLITVQNTYYLVWSPVELISLLNDLRQVVPFGIMFWLVRMSVEQRNVGSNPIIGKYFSYSLVSN